MKRKKLKYGTCILCGTYGEITREHAPPRSAFPKPKPSNCITVPTCRCCNSGMSDLDEDFGNFLGVLAGNTSEEGTRLWEQRLPAIHRNNRKYKELLDNIRAIPNADGSDPDFYLVKQDYKKFEPIYDKCFRALYFEKYNQVYPTDKGFEFFYPKTLEGEPGGLFKYLYTRNIGANHVFYCGVARTEESEDVFAAALIFYDKFVVIGMTEGVWSS